MRRSPVDEVAAAQTFYASLGHDVTYFAALWHTYNVGHMLVTNLNQICRQYDLSSADFNLLGALGIEKKEPIRASDLAITLQVSNAALSSRIDKLALQGLLIKSAAETDRRSFTLELTAEGVRKIEEVHAAIAREAHFVRQFHRLSDDERKALERIMGKLHTELDRDFIHVHR
jgi:DNA-binding MarR family transcriptional regulator